LLLLLLELLLQGLQQVQEQAVEQQHTNNSGERTMADASLCQSPCV
jgi:hypothetical protein